MSFESIVFYLTPRSVLFKLRTSFLIYYLRIYLVQSPFGVLPKLSLQKCEMCVQ